MDANSGAPGPRILETYRSIDLPVWTPGIEWDPEELFFWLGAAGFRARVADWSATVSVSLSTSVTLAVNLKFN